MDFVFTYKRIVTFFFFFWNGDCKIFHLADVVSLCFLFCFQEMGIGDACTVVIVNAKCDSVIGKLLGLQSLEFWALMD